MSNGYLCHSLHHCPSKSCPTAIIRGVLGAIHRKERGVRCTVKIMEVFILEHLIYENKLACQEDIQGFVLEGKAYLTFENNHLRMKNILSREEHDQLANYVLWCPVEFPDNIRIEWNFHPIQEPGLCMMMFSMV